MSEILALIIIMAFTLVLTGIIMGITPYITRKNTQFGVILPEHAHEHSKIKKYKKQFVVFNIGFSLLGVLSLFIGLNPNLSEEQATHFVIWGGTAIITIFILVSFILYYHYHKKIKTLKQEIYCDKEVVTDARIMVATNFRSGNQPIAVSNKGFILIGMIVIAITAILPIIYYNQIPDQVPINFGLDGTPTSYSNKSPHLFAVMPITQLLLLPLLIFANYSFKRAKQQLKPRNPKVSIEQNRAFRYAWSKYLVAVGIGILILLAYIQYMMILALDHVGIFLFVTFLIVAPTLGWPIYLALKYGQGGERYQPSHLANHQESSHQVVDDDEYWKLGVFYFNPNDSAIFVEKRFGVGMTFNYARWQTWAFVVGTMVLTLLTVVLAMSMI